MGHKPHNNKCDVLCWKSCVRAQSYSIPIRWKNSIRFGSIHADESIFRFDSIRQFDKMDACII